MSIPLLKRKFNESRGIIQSQAVAAPSPGAADAGKTSNASRPSTHRVNAKPTRGAANYLKVGLAVLFTLAGLAVVVPRGVVAVNSDWTTEYANSISTDSVREISLAHDGERIGMAYRFASTNAIGFSVRAAGPSPGVWTSQNAAAVAAATVLTDIKLVNTGAGKWLIVGAPTGFGQLNTYTSTDDGVTWTAHAAAIGGAISTYDVAALSATKLGLAWCDGAVVGYRDSTDGGATWNGGPRLDDNSGNPGVSNSGTAVGCVSGNQVAITGDGAGEAVVAFARGSLNQAFYVQSTGGSDSFWTVPYYNGGSCPSGCSPVDGATTVLPWITNGVANTYGFAFPQNNDLLAVVRNGNSCGNLKVSSLRFNANQLGLPATESASSACTGFTPATNAWDIVTDNSCTASENTFGDKIAGNSVHTFIMGVGHTTLCSGVGFEIRLKTGMAGAWSQTFNDPSQTKVFDVDMTSTKSYAAFVDTTTGGQVKVVSANTPTTSNVGPVYTRTLTGEIIKGMAIDPYNQALILRTLNIAGAAEKIRALNPASATLPDMPGPSPQTNSCTFDADTGSTYRSDGVMAYHEQPDTTGNGGGKNFLGYLDCTSAGNKDANHWHVGDGGLNNPDQSGTLCTDFCAFDITNGSPPVNGNCGGNVMPARAKQIDNIQAVPISYRTGTNTLLSPRQVILGFAYNDRLNGNVGVWTIKFVNNSPDVSCETSLPFSTPGLTKQICSWRNKAADGGDGSDYIAAVGGTDAQARAWNIQVDTSSNIDEGPAISMNQQGIFTSPWDHDVAIGCSDEYVALENTAGHIHVLNILPVSGVAPVGLLPWSGGDLVTSTLIDRGLAFSGDHHWLTYVDGTNIKVANALTGVVVATQAITGTGTVQQIFIDDTGQFVWVALNNGVTDSTVQAFDVHAQTTGTANTCPPGVRSAGCNNLNGNNTNPCVGQVTNDGTCISNSNSATTTSANGCTSTNCGVTSGSGCADNYQGDVIIGKTYVPLGTWTNCASMALETIGTMLLMAGAVVLIAIKTSDGQNKGSPNLIGGMAVVGYMLSMYLWKAPILIPVVLIIIAVAIVLIRGKLSANTGGSQ